MASACIVILSVMSLMTRMTLLTTLPSMMGKALLSRNFPPPIETWVSSLPEANDRATGQSSHGSGRPKKYS